MCAERFTSSRVMLADVQTGNSRLELKPLANLNMHFVVLECLCLQVVDVHQTLNFNVCLPTTSYG